MDEHIKILRQYPIKKQKNGEAVEIDVVEIGVGKNPGIVLLELEKDTKILSTYEGWITGSDGKVYLMKVEKNKVIDVKEVNKMY